MHTVFDETNPERLTLVDILRRRAQHEPKREAYTFLLDSETRQVQMTYADLDHQASRIAAQLQTRVAPGERVLLLYPPGLEYVAAIFGCFYAGVVAVPAYPPRLNQSLMRIQTILQDGEVTAVLTTSTILSSVRRTKAFDPPIQNLHWIATDMMDPQAVLPNQESNVDPGTLALLQYTSGSTGSPKGVMLTHGNLMQNAALIEEAMSLTPRDRGMFWLPPYHDMGLMAGILQALYTGGPTVLMTPAAFLQKPLRWLQAISSLKVTISGGPGFAFDLCVRSATEDAIKSLDLSSWAVAFTGAEPIRAETLARFAETFAPCGFRPETFCPCYGLAEATLFVSGGHRLRGPLLRRFGDRQALETGRVVEVTGDQGAGRLLVGCGYVRQGQEVAIVDPQTHTRCAPGTVGEIWVKGPNVALGYWGKAEETAQTFQAFLRGEVGAVPNARGARHTGCPTHLSDEGPFLRTGDLGFFVEKELFVTGRLKDLIIIRGRNLYPQDIEQVVEKSHPLLRPSCCATFAVEGPESEQLVVVQEVDRHANDVGAQEAIQTIRQAVLSEFDVEVAAVELLRMGTIPKTTSGKIQRRVCRRSFLKGDLNAVYRWNRIQKNTPSNKEATPPTRVGTGSAQGTGRGQAPSAPVPTRFTPTVQEIIDWLVKHIAERAQIDTRVIDLHAPFVQFGLNSLEAIGLSGKLEQWLGRSFSPTLIYDYPSIEALAHHLAGADQLVGTKPGADKDHTRQTDAIAIIGLGCRFPGADNPEAFWQVLYDGIDGISEVPATRWDITQFYAPDQARPGKMNTCWGGFLPHIEQFDPSFFHISPREARQMDPQQRLLLEVAWETLENAGQAPDKLAGSQTGVFIGISSDDYAHLHLKNVQFSDAYAGTGNAHSIAANRLSYTLDLHGPSMAIDTACSSSLVAVHQACQSLRNGECDLALAGGVNVILSPELTITFSQARMMSSDGHCKTFDEAADGYVRGEGCGLVLLKPLAAALRDGDTILSIVRGEAVNQDGRSNGLTAPHGPSQEAVIRRALQNAGITASQISYVETHGSSTSLGDPIEVDALKAVLMQHRSPDQPCLLGAVKTNVGHLEAAAGIAGLIKTVLCLHKGVIAPNLHFKRLNPHISLAGTTFEIPTEPCPWPGSPDTPRFAGVSAFGFGGTNVHVILESPPHYRNNTSDLSKPEATSPHKDSASSLSERRLHLLTLSGRTAQALTVLAQRYQEFLETHPTVSLADLCFTANTGRTHFAHRLAVYAENTEEMCERLAAFIAGQFSKGLQVGYGETRKGQAPPLSSLQQDHDDWHVLMQSITNLYCNGYDLNWSDFYGGSTHRKITLPTYPFEREYCWFRGGDPSWRTELVSVQPETDERDTNEINQWLYQLHWEAVDLPRPMAPISPGHWLIFLDQKGIGQHLSSQLREQGHTCTLIETGQNFQLLDQHHYQVNPANPQEIKQAVGTALAAVRPLHGVIHLWSLDTTPVTATNLSTLEADQVLGVQSALSLIQALIEQSVQTRLWLITQGAQPVEATDTDLAVSQAPIWGLGKTCAMEHPELWGGLTDLDPRAIVSDVANQLMRVLQGGWREDQIALRGATTYVARMVQYTLQEPHALHISSSAAYLITGGLWGLGLECARWLATQGARYLILLGRSQLPPRETWEQVQPESRHGIQIAGIRAIERLGAQVHHESVDVANSVQLTEFLHLWNRRDSALRLSEERPPIHGIIHAASVWQDTQGQSLVRPLASLNTKDLVTVLRPKMLGGWLLSNLLKETPLDFFVSFSSGATLLGSAAQGNYAAASEFLDVLAHHQRAHGQPAISIDWGAISEIGYGATPEGLRVHEYWESHGIGRLSPQQVLAALELLIQEDLPRVGVLRLDWQLLRQFYPQMADRPLVSRLVSSRKETGDAAHEGTHNKPDVHNGASILQTLRNAYEEEHAAILTSYVKAQIATILRVPVQSLEIEEPLTSLGFDSLMAIELKNRIDLDLQIRLPVAILLQEPSITQLVKQVLALAPSRVETVGTALVPAALSSDEKTTVGESPVGALTETPQTGTVAIGQGQESGTVGMGASPVPTRPLSHNQRALWFLSRLEPESTAYNLLYVARIQQHLDVPALQRALLVLAARYPILTSTYKLQNGEPVQQTHAGQILPLEVIDANSRSLDDLKCLLLEEGNRPIDLTKGPVLRLLLYQRTDDDHLLSFILHHIVADFWALDLLADELSRLYAIEKTDMAELERQVLDRWPGADFQHADYVRWQQSMLQSQEGEQHWRYWQNALAGDLPVLNLPTDRLRPPLQTYKGASQGFSFSTDLAKRLRSIANKEQVTLFTLMLTAYQVLLHRYNHQDDILVGTPALGRTRSEFERIIGSLANPVVVRARFGQNITFKELLQQTKRGLLAALEHQDFPLPFLVERLQLQRDPSYSPIYQTLFIWDRPRTHNREDRAGHSHAGQGQALSLRPFAYGQQGAPLDLTLTVFEIDDQLSADFRYNVDLFDAPTIARMSEHFLTLLDGITNNLDQHIRELPLLPDNIRQTLLTEWNATHCGHQGFNPWCPQDLCVHQLFEQQVEQTPDSVALVFGEDQALTYAELNQQANRLAHHLQGLGIGPDDLVGIYMERSIQMVVGLLAVLKAGGAYVPLDPAYPQERLAFIIADSQITIVLTHHLFDSRPLPVIDGIGKVINFDTNWNVTDSPDQRRENPLAPVTPANLAYVIYTSGSTGKPKGTMVTHRNVVNFFTAMDQRIGDHVPGRWLAVTSISFDISVLELFWTLTRGFQVVIQSDQQERLQPRSSPRGKATSEGSLSSHQTKDLEFSLFYFANDTAEAIPARTGASPVPTFDGGASPAATVNRYRLLLEGAKFADTHNFAAVWTPERHFHSFGGLYPNPSVTGAAIATVTQKIQIRAGSVVLPLHDPVRVAEEWAVVDNLSAGRVGLSFATGWHANDFVLAPEQYTNRKKILTEKIETVRKLWRGETMALHGPNGNMVPVKIYPQPIQPELPIWMTSSGNPETFQQAGEMGMNLLTHLLGQNIESLAEKIAIYRDAWQQHGHAGSGHVTLMLHTFIGTESATVREQVRQPFTNYLRSSVELFQTLARSLGYSSDLQDLSEDDLNAILAHGFERYYETGGLMGTVSTCLPMVERLKEIGVDEVACLIDFGVDEDAVLTSLHELAKLKDRGQLAGRRLVEAGSAQGTIPTAPVPSVTRDLPFPAPPTGKPEVAETLPTKIKRQGITHLQCTPSLASVLLLEPGGESALGSLQKLLLGGEALPISLVKQLNEFVAGEIHNMYGPTETTIWSTTQRMEKNASTVSIGRPIANTQVYILDKYLQLLPIGVPGELFIGGKGVVRGYLNQPSLTAEKFLPNPYATGEPGALMYRTGDVARYLPSGTIEYLGRIDQQVKLRGFRIELGEVEAALQAHPAVQEAVVILREESEGRKYLIAYVVPVPTALAGRVGEPPSVLELQEHLREQLPDYMVPTSVVFLDRLPLSPNGKVDRKALAQGTGQGHVGARTGAVGTGLTPVPTSTLTASGGHKPTFVAPREPVEHTLTTIWQQVLGRDLVGIHDNFFALGGDSILSMQMIARARQAGLELTLKQFFQHQTIAQLARVARPLEQVRSKMGTVGTGLAPVRVPDQWLQDFAEVTGPVLLTPIQRWFLEQDLSQPQHFNQAVMLEVSSSWHLQHLQQVVDMWLVQHDALRLRYERTAAGWQQRLVSVAEAGTVTVERIDLTEEGSSDQALANGQAQGPVPTSMKIELVANRMQASLNLERGPLLRVVLFDLDGGRASRLLVVIHHLAVDGISWRVLISDLLVGMAQLRKGEPITLLAKTASFQRWALHLQELAQSTFLQRERAYWLRVVQTPTAPLPVELVGSGSAQGSGQAQGTVPTDSDHGRGSERCNTGASARTVSVALTREETQLLLQEAPRPYRSNIQELLLVPLLQTLARWIGTQTLRLDLEGHGREELGDLDVSRTVGWFTSLYPVLFTLPQNNGSQPSDRHKRAGTVGAAGDPYESQWIKTIKEQLRTFHYKGIGYGLLRYISEDRELREKLASATPSQVIFNYLGQFDQMVVNSPETSETIQATLESIGAVSGPENQRCYLLEVDGLVLGGQLHLRWTYSEQLHEQTTIEALAQEFLQALRDLLVHCLSPEAGGLTPSDFPLAHLDQATLDRLLATCSHRTGIKHSSGGIEDLYPLTPLQQGLLFHTLSAPQSGIYIEQVSCTLRGEVEVGAFERAWQQVIKRHTILRTAFVWQELSEPLQIVFEQAQLPISILDWQSRSQEQQEADLEAFLRADRAQGFDLQQAPLMRVTLVRLGETHVQMIWTHHHLLLDGWSQSRLLREMLACYEAEIQGMSLVYEEPRPYRDYVNWLAEQDGESAEAYWRQALTGITAPTPLGVDRNVARLGEHQSVASGQGQSPPAYAEEVLQVEPVSVAQWQEYAQQQHVTLYTLVQATWALVLSRYSGQTDVIFGTVVAGRPPELVGVEHMIGLFINAVPVRVQVHNAEKVGAWLKQLYEQQIEQRPYEYSSLVQIQSWCNHQARHDGMSSERPVGPESAQAASGRSVLFESLLIFDNYPLAAGLSSTVGAGLAPALEAIQVVEQTNYPLTIAMEPGVGRDRGDDSRGRHDPLRRTGPAPVRPQPLRLRVSYDPQRFERATIQRLLLHWRTVLQQLVANPQQQLGSISLLTEAEREQILAQGTGVRNVQWNATKTEDAGDMCVHYLIERQVEQTPEAIAVVFEDTALTYRELNAQANHLAHRLLEEGVGPEVLIGVYMERSLELVVALLAVLKAGGAYVPLDPELPQERLVYMIQDAQIALVLTQSHLRGHLKAVSATIMTVDVKIEGQEHNPLNTVQLHHLVYMIYTSGSTGKPKGTMNTHHGLCNRLLWMQETYQLTPRDRVLQKTPFSFDVSIWEFFWPLLTGASLIMARPGGHHDPAYLKALIAEQAVSTLHFVPSMLQAFLGEQDLQNCQSLRQVMCSGEALTASLQAHFFAHVTEEVKLHNLYGPTEAAIDVTFWECQRDQDRRDSSLRLSDYRVPIGHPIANTQIYLLDADLQPVPIGMPGELYIGGVGLARGYWGRPDLTAERFIPNPFVGTGHPFVGTEHKPFVGTGLVPVQGERLYRTGDLARYRADGAIEFLGRIDQQVKLRGLRIELGEIEAILQAHPAVQKAVVMLYEEDKVGPYLAAYVVPAVSPLEGQDSDRPPNREELQSYLRKQLPDYMVPTVFVFLKTLPLTLSGKVNRRALPVPERTVQSDKGYVAPQSELEQRLSEIWQQVLGVETRVGIYDNFFDLGGHSLLLIQVCSKLQGSLGYEVPIVDLFNYPTIHALSTHLSGRQEQRPLLQPITERVQKRKASLQQSKGKRGTKER